MIRMISSLLQKHWRESLRWSRIAYRKSMILMNFIITTEQGLSLIHIFCMRLALVDAMYPDEKPFLVLDDPFVNLDEEKVVHGNELLSKIAGEYQILYFTCHSSRM